VYQKNCEVNIKDTAVKYKIKTKKNKIQKENSNRLLWHWGRIKLCRRFRSAVGIKNKHKMSQASDETVIFTPRALRS